MFLELMSLDREKTYLISKNLQPILDTCGQRHTGRDSRQAILPDALRVNANLFQTDLCRNPEAKDGILNLHPCSLDTGAPCRYDDFREQLKFLANQDITSIRSTNRISYST